MTYLFTSESVSEGHPDKVADQISDTILDNYIAFDNLSRVACETLVTKNRVIIAGEIKSSSNLDVEAITRDIINSIGYTKDEYQFNGNSCEITSLLHGQTQDIRQGVDRGSESEQGAGDQGMMFGYAINETESYMPLSLDISHTIMRELSKLRKENEKIKYLRPDAKCQVTVKYDSKTNKPICITSIIISTQHDEFDNDDDMLSKIREDISNILMPRVKSLYDPSLFTDEIEYHINPTGRFVDGGPFGDTGLTGRKIIVDTYGGRGAHGGGAFSGKDSSKVDRSAAYATRHIAKNLVAAGVADEVLVQVSYAIGVSTPISILVKTFGTSKINLTDSEISDEVYKLFDMTPNGIDKRLKLREPIYLETAKYGHMGRTPEVVSKSYIDSNGKSITKDVELFTWEKLDYVDEIQKIFKIKYDEI